VGGTYDPAPPTLFLSHLVTITMAIARIGRATNRNATVPSAAVTMTVAMDMVMTERYGFGVLLVNATYILT
jgi:hypothetical protein